jgi:hypothetical protein
MLYIDEEASHRPLKEMKTLDLALPKIPTKVLYNMHISVTQEIQSKAGTDATNLQTTQEEKNALREEIIQEEKEIWAAQQKVEEMEKCISIVFHTISVNVESEETSSQEKMRKIA